MRDYAVCAALLAVTYGAVALVWVAAAAGWAPAVIILCIAGIAYAVGDAVWGSTYHD
jgi:1,4-dihydroxy-2-naphthoate octaprenyltransferase